MIKKRHKFRAAKKVPQPLLSGYNIKKEKADKTDKKYIAKQNKIYHQEQSERRFFHGQSWQRSSGDSDTGGQRW